VRFEHLYIHVPFCSRRCVYCDFSIAVRRQVPVAEFLRALDTEWAVRHDHADFALQTLYFGGGTPSKLGVGGVTRLIELVRRRATIHDNAEITLEVNPEDVALDVMRDWLAAGVNRFSIGVQSFDDRVLAWMRRTHDSNAARRAISIARDAGARNISIDLIFATPSDVARDWSRDLDEAASLSLPHVSIYGMTVEPRTPLGRWVARRDVAEAPEEQFESEFLLTHNVLTSAGMEHYEVSSYGLPGCHSRHNWAYWLRAPYGGLGPAAHEFDGSSRRWNAAAYVEWRSRCARGSDPAEGSEHLDDAQVSAELMYLGLRTTLGVQLDGRGVERTAPWLEANWATLDSNHVLRLTALGWLRADKLATDLTLLGSRY
jgi:oxygen-independent coproporphyrinogen III oxidase